MELKGRCEMKIKGLFFALFKVAVQLLNNEPVKR